MAGNRSRDLKKQLEQEIVTGKLSPGTKLDEKTLTERFKVSRTPVREALHQLSSIGLIEILPRRGATVRKVSLRDLIEMFEVMAELEGLCGFLAAQRMNDSDIDLLRQKHLATKPLLNQVDYDRYYDANVDFHECIYQGSQNNYLAQQTLQLRNRLAPYRRVQLHQPKRIEKSFAEHEQILLAIEARDAAKASDLLKAHITVQQGSFSGFVSSLPLDMLREE